MQCTFHFQRYLLMQTARFALPSRETPSRPTLLPASSPSPCALLTTEIMSVHFESRRGRRNNDGAGGAVKESGERKREREKRGRTRAERGWGKGGEWKERGREYWLTCNTESEGGRDPTNIKYIITFILISFLAPTYRPSLYLSFSLTLVATSSSLPRAQTTTANRCNCVWKDRQAGWRQQWEIRR